METRNTARKRRLFCTALKRVPSFLQFLITCPGVIGSGRKGNRGFSSFSIEVRSTGAAVFMLSSSSLPHRSPRQLAAEHKPTNGFSAAATHCSDALFDESSTEENWSYAGAAAHSAIRLCDDGGSCCFTIRSCVLLVCFVFVE